MMLYRHYKGSVYLVLFPSVSLSFHLPVGAQINNLMEARWEPEPSVPIVIFDIAPEGPKWAAPVGKVELGHTMYGIPTNTILVVYQSFSEPEKIWCRTYKNFHSLVSPGVSRFSPVE